MNDDFPDPIEAMMAERLQRERPIPRPAFRGDLRRRVVAAGVPRAVWRRAALAATGGLACFAATALGLAGVGPLG